MSVVERIALFVDKPPGLSGFRSPMRMTAGWPSTKRSRPSPSSRSSPTPTATTASPPPNTPAPIHRGAMV